MFPNCLVCSLLLHAYGPVCFSLYFFSNFVIDHGISKGCTVIIKLILDIKLCIIHELIPFISHFEVNNN